MRAAADAAAQAHDRARLDGRAARRGADGDVVHLARAHHRAARERQGAGRLSARDYPGAHGAAQQRQGAHSCRCARRCWRPRRTCRRPPRTAASATSTTSTSSTAPTATRRRPAPSRWRAVRTPSTGSPRSTCSGKLHHFKVVTYLKMGCPLTTEKVPLVMGDNRPYPKCHTWNERVMQKLIADHPDYVFTTVHPAVEHQARRRDAGHLHRDLADVRRTTTFRSSRCGTPRGWCATASPSSPPTAWPSGGNAHLLRDQALRRTVRPQPDAGFRRAVPAAETARHERCGVPQGRLPRRGGKCVAVPRLSPHLRRPTCARWPTNSDVRSAQPPAGGDSRAIGARAPMVDDVLTTVWPGTPIPSAPPTTARAPTSRCSPRSPRRSNCA